MSQLRTSRHRVEAASIGSTEGEVLLSRIKARENEPQTIEQELLVQQAVQQLTPQERKITLLKKADYTSAEIAAALGISVGAVDQANFRAKHKLRKLLTSRREED